MTCAREGCGRPAKWAPKICIPARGHAIGKHAPLSAILNLPVCDAHMASLDVGDFVDAGTEGGRVLRAACVQLAAGRAAPDFDRAFVERVALGSPEHLAFERDRREGLH